MCPCNEKTLGGERREGPKGFGPEGGGAHRLQQMETIDQVERDRFSRCLCLCGFVVAAWAFRLDQNVLAQTPATGGRRHFPGNSIFSHTGDGAFRSGVCVLGKVGAWISIALMCHVLVSPPGESRRNAGRLIAVALMATAGLSFVMNRGLFYRAVALFVIQAMLVATIIG